MKAPLLALLLCVSAPAWACTNAGDVCADGSWLLKVDTAAKLKTFASSVSVREQYGTAAATCSNMTADGHDDWRLGDRNEVQLVASIIKASTYVWSSTMGGTYNNQVWASRWYNNALVENLQGTSAYNYTRCVRTQAIPDDPPPTGGGGGTDPGTNPGTGQQACVAVTIQAAQLGPQTFAINFVKGFGLVFVPFVVAFFGGRVVMSAVGLIGGR